MSEKKVTLLLVSHDSAKTRRWTISVQLFRILSISAFLIGITFVAVVLDYMGLLVQTAENKRLKAENSMLLAQFDVAEQKLTALESSLERVKTFTTKLKLITNVESEDRQLNLALGATPAPGQPVKDFDQPMDEREAVKDIAESEAGFESLPPVNESKGELAVETNKDYRSLAIRVDKAIKDSQLREQSVLDLWEALSERQGLLNATPNIKPARGWISSRFGYRISPFTGKMTLHAGLDIAAAPGSPVYAPADGVVIFSGYDEGYGKLVSIDHGYGITTRFGHNSQVYVQIGQRVRRWDVIASVGNTGRSTAPHCHYEVRVNGVPRDPINYILND